MTLTRAGCASIDHGQAERGDHKDQQARRLADAGRDNPPRTADARGNQENR